MAITPVFALERTMREPVKAWLRTRGFLPAVEFYIWHAADIVAGRYGPRPAARRKPPILERIAIELKLDDVAGVIRQAVTNAKQVERSYCAMPSDRIERMRPATLDKFRAAGVGLISVGSFVIELIRPIVNDKAPTRINRQLWKRTRSAFIAQEG